MVDSVRNHQPRLVKNLVDDPVPAASGRVKPNEVSTEGAPELPRIVQKCATHELHNCCRPSFRKSQEFPLR